MTRKQKILNAQVRAWRKWWVLKRAMLDYTNAAGSYHSTVMTAVDDPPKKRAR